MLERLAYWTVVWPLRTFHYPLIRFLGRLSGKEELADRIIEVSEENIDRTMSVLEGTDE